MDSADGYSIDTAVIHAGTELVKGAAVTPIFQSATFGHRGDGPEEDVAYLRPADTPNHAVSICSSRVIEPNVLASRPG
jgi:cystathionine beta-lyase/cystathionine gamma-synthase